MRWLYVRLGITSSSSTADARSSTVLLEAGTADLDMVLDSQLELCDYGSSSGDTRLRDVNKPKANHSHRV